MDNSVTTPYAASLGVTSSGLIPAIKLNTTCSRFKTDNATMMRHIGNKVATATVSPDSWANTLKNQTSSATRQTAMMPRNQAFVDWAASNERNRSTGIA